MHDGKKKVVASVLKKFISKWFYFSLKNCVGNQWVKIMSGFSSDKTANCQPDCVECFEIKCGRCTCWTRTTNERPVQIVLGYLWWPCAKCDENKSFSLQLWWVNKIQDKKRNKTSNKVSKKMGAGLFKSSKMMWNDGKEKNKIENAMNRRKNFLYIWRNVWIMLYQNVWIFDA